MSCPSRCRWRQSNRSAASSTILRSAETLGLWATRTALLSVWTLARRSRCGRSGERLASDGGKLRSCQHTFGQRHSRAAGQEAVLQSISVGSTGSVHDHGEAAPRAQQETSRCRSSSMRRPKAKATTAATTIPSRQLRTSTARSSTWRRHSAWRSARDCSRKQSASDRCCAVFHIVQQSHQ